MKKFVAGFAVAGMLLPSVALAGIGEELTLAQQHALLAYRFGGRGPGPGARPHLHEVLNGLVGPGGEGYNVTPPNMNPCAGSGKGALNDAASPAQKAKITAAIAMVKAAFEINEAPAMEAAATDLADA